MLTVREFARALAVSTDTVYRAIRRGHIKAIRLPASNHLRIAPEEMARALAKRAGVNADE
jgi:excisionase family DNA binding protein